MNSNHSLSAKRKIGRPSVRTAEALKAILQAIADGCPLRGAASIGGISYTTLCEWRRENPEVELAILASREKARQAALVRLRAAGEKDWRATEAWLRCAFPEDYRAKAENVQAVQISQAVTPCISAERLKEIQDRRKAALSEAGFSE